MLTQWDWSSPGEAGGGAESGDKITQSFLVTCVSSRIELPQGALDPQARKDGRCAMTWSDNIDHVEILFANEEIEVSVHQRKSRTGAPMAYNTISLKQTGRWTGL